MSTEEWVEKIYAQHVEAEKIENPCIICQDLTFKKGIAFTPRPPTQPLLFPLCYACRQLPGYQDEVNQLLNAHLRSIGLGHLLGDESEDEEIN